jgi:transcriptional regulator with XRE-family HTH domain
MHVTTPTAGKKAPNSIDVHVGSRIRLRRMTLDMSQTDLGAQLGVTFQQIQKYEKGTNRVGASRVQAIARALSVPVSWFFEDAPEVGKGSEDVFAGLSKEAQALAILFDRLGERDRVAVLAVARALSKD